MALVFFLYALFASVFTIGKITLTYSSPFFLVGSRMTAAAILILSSLLFKDRKRVKVEKKDLPSLFLLGLINIYLVNVLEFWGLQFLTSFKACFIYSLSPFVSAVLSYLFLKETLSWKKWGGLALGSIGFLPILLHSTPLEEAVGQLWIFSWPEIVVAAGAVLSCFGWILLKTLVKNDRNDPLAINGWSMLIGGSVALFHSFLQEDWSPFPVTDGPAFIRGALALLVISNLLAYNLYGHLLKKFSATFISFAGFTTPLFTAIFGYLFLGEVVTWPFILSYGIVYLGLKLFYGEEVKEEQLCRSSP